MVQETTQIDSRSALKDGCREYLGVPTASPKSSLPSPAPMIRTCGGAGVVGVVDMLRDGNERMIEKQYKFEVRAELRNEYK